MKSFVMDKSGQRGCLVMVVIRKPFNTMMNLEQTF